MTDISGEEERRLAETYSQMEEAELQALADNGYELTEAAREALQAEIRQRGLDLKLRDTAPPVVEDPMSSPLVTLQVVSDITEAHRLQDILDTAAIPYSWGPRNPVNIDVIGSSLNESYALQVSRYDAPRAIQVIGDASPSEPENESEYIPVCPKCHSPEIVFMRRESDLEAVPKSDEKFNWTCEACGNQWTDEGIEEEAPASQ